MKTVYILRTYKAKETLKTFKTVEVDNVEITSTGQIKATVKGEIISVNRYETLTETKPKDAIDITGLKLLPHYSDIKQDTNHRLGEPKIYRECQLMAETRGGYLYYWHKPTQQKLLIAINSNYWI